jgi:DNA-binding response OmpR family regulator
MEGHQYMTIGNVMIDPQARTVTVEGEILNLNRKEFDILLYMTTNKNRLVQKTALAEHVWGDYIDESFSISAWMNLWPWSPLPQKSKNSNCCIPP